MRKLPIYFLIDISESMAGNPIEEVQKGMRTIIQELRVDPYALETVFVSIIGFAGKAKVITPLTELYKFYPPVLPLGGGTSLGAGLELLMKCMDSEVTPTTMESKGDWKPIVFLFTDGTPTDNYQPAFKKWNEKYRNKCNLVAISLGDEANVLILGQITDNVLLLNRTDKESFSQFFKWVTTSIKTMSKSVTDTYSDNIKLAPTSGINLEKVSPYKEYCGEDIDENFAILRAKCSNTHQDYLIKYAKRLDHLGIPGLERYDGNYFRLVGAYPIDGAAYDELSVLRKGALNTEEIIGSPSCPCCGNQYGMVVCECGNIMCSTTEGKTKCPWCGLEGTLGTIGEGGLDINRGIG